MQHTKSEHAQINKLQTFKGKWRRRRLRRTVGNVRIGSVIWGHSIIVIMMSRNVGFRHQFGAPVNRFPRHWRRRRRFRVISGQFRLDLILRLSLIFSFLRVRSHNETSPVIPVPIRSRIGSRVRSRGFRLVDMVGFLRLRCLLIHCSRRFGRVNGYDKESFEMKGKFCLDRSAEAGARKGSRIRRRRVYREGRSYAVQNDDFF